MNRRFGFGSIAVASFLSLGVGSWVGASWPEQDPSSRLVAGFLRMEELTSAQVATLDRDSTLLFLPIGNIEQHGPHLPLGTDLFVTEWVVDRLARQVGKALPSWTMVVLPTQKYGTGGTESLAPKQLPGTYAITAFTLRAVVAELGTQLADAGFQRIFVVHSHGDPNHNLAISEAADFVSATTGITMLNLNSTHQAMASFEPIRRRIAVEHYSAPERQRIGFDIHAGTMETSAMLAISPAFVARGLDQ